MYEVDNLSLMDQVPRQVVRNAPGIRWIVPLGSTTPAESGIEQRLNPVGSLVYDALDRRLMDTFPASDAVARY